MAPRPELDRNAGTGSTTTTSSRPPLPGRLSVPDVRDCPSRRKSSVPRPKEEEEVELVAPDGGWGWYVVMGTMLVNLVVIGHAKSFGVYFNVLMREFDATPSKVAWLQAINYSMFSFMSPVISVVSQRLGPRRVALFGGMLGCVGMIFAAYTPNIQFLYLYYGVLQGISLTCTFTPGITMIAKYFCKRRGMANGLALGGNALGGMVIPMVVDRLIAAYDLRGCFLIMGGILLHACVGAMFWQPVEWHQKKKKRRASDAHKNKQEVVPSTSRYDAIMTADCFVPILLEKCDAMSDNSPTSVEYFVGQCPTRRTNSEQDFSSRTSVDVEDLFYNMSPGDKNTSFLAWNPNCVLSADLSNCNKMQRNSSSPHLGEHLKSVDKVYNSTESLPNMHKLSPKPLRLRPTSQISSSFLYLSSYNLGPTSGAVLTKEHFKETDSILYKAKSTQSIDIASTKAAKKKSRNWLCCLIFDGISIDKTIFEKSRFYIMTVSIFFHVLGYPGTLMFLPYHATSLGYSQAKAAFLLSVLALTDLTGRIVFAWLSDFQICPRKYWFVGGMLLSGIFAYSLPWYDSYLALSVGTAGFGFSCGAYIGLVVVMFADAYRPEEVALAYSISTVSGGFMAIGGPPLMGYVLETTGSYFICQCILGSAQVAGAAIWVVEPWALDYERRREKAKSTRNPEEEQLV